MTTVFDSELSGRDFGSNLLHVGDLLEWAKNKRLHLRATPAIDGTEFVQVEALLCAIERQAIDLTPSQALEIVLNSPALKSNPIFQKYPEDIDPTHCRWLIGAAAHAQWRKLLSAAIAARELALLDFGSKLPIDTAPAQSNTAPVETPEQRRARWLAMFEAEEKRMKRGALQRLANSEGVDRSNMGKDIAKAREERDTQRRAGMWTVQRVQDGKRQP